MFSKPYSKIFYTELAFGVIIHVAMLTAIPDTAQLAFTPSAELFFALWVVIFPLLLILFTIPFIWNKKSYFYVTFRRV